MPNPLTDELSAEAKAELAAIFADMRRRLDAIWEPPRKPWRRQPFERRGW